MTYKEMIPILQSSHFYPSENIEVSKKGEKVIGLSVECPSIILMDDRVKRIREVLDEAGANNFQVDGMKNHGYILIQNKK